MKRNQLFLVNMLVLTVSSLVLQSVGMTFQVYLANKLGPEGLGLFQLITSVYFLMIVLATSGVRFTVTRLCAEEMGAKRPAGAIRTVLYGFAYAALFGTAAMLLLLFGARFVGVRWLGDARTVPSLRIFALSLPFISMSSVIGGYFIAVRKAAITSAVLFFEQAVKIVLTVFFLGMYLPRGLESACAGIVLGSVIGEMASFLLSLLLYCFGRGRVSCAGENRQGLVGRMLRIALPVASSAYVVSVLSTLQQLLIPYGLKKSGSSGEEALSTLGVIRGMALPLLMFPSVLLDAVAELIVPELAEYRAGAETGRMRGVIARVIHAGILVSVCVTVVFVRYADELGAAVYQNAGAAYYIRVFAPLVPMLYLDRIVDSMLKGIGEQVASMRYNILTSALSAALIFFLLPRYAATGFVITFYAAKVINFTLSLRRLIRCTDLQIDWLLILKALFCMIGSVSIADLLFRLMRQGENSAAISLWIRLPVSVVVYLALLVIFGCITRRYLEWARSITR